MVSIDVSSRLCPGYVVVALRGELDISDATRFASALSAAVASGPRIIVDLAELTFMDCTGLHALVSARDKARQVDGDLLLAAPQQPLVRLLSLTDVIGLLPVFASVNEAANGARKLLAAVGLAPERADGEALPGNGEVNPAGGEASPAGAALLATGDAWRKAATITNSGGGCDGLWATQRRRPTGLPRARRLSDGPRGSSRPSR